MRSIRAPTLTPHNSTPLLTFFFFFFNDTATTEIYTLSLHDALPIWLVQAESAAAAAQQASAEEAEPQATPAAGARSEEHTSELQSRLHLVCRLLLEKKKKATGLRIQLITSFESMRS